MWATLGLEIIAQLRVNRVRAKPAEAYIRSHVVNQANEGPTKTLLEISRIEFTLPSANQACSLRIIQSRRIAASSGIKRTHDANI